MKEEKTQANVLTTERVFERKLILWAWYNPELVKNKLVFEIEKNGVQCERISQTAYNTFQENKFAKNSLYFHHGYADYDIPIGQEYEAIAFMENGKIQTASIQKCKAKVLCFFSIYKTLPSNSAMRGHHGLSLIQFEQDIPQIIYELYEVKELKPLEFQKEICLCSKTMSLT